MILLFRFEVPFNTYLKSLKLGILQKHLKIDKSIAINLGVPKDASHQLFCILYNCYVSGTHDTGVTKSLPTRKFGTYHNLDPLLYFFSQL